MGTPSEDCIVCVHSTLIEKGGLCLINLADVSIYSTFNSLPFLVSKAQLYTYVSPFMDLSVKPCEHGALMMTPDGSSPLSSHRS